MRHRCTLFEIPRFALAVAALAVALTSCKPPPTAPVETAEADPVDLPAYSTGTLQAMGPHAFESRRVVEVPDGGTGVSRNERVRLDWISVASFHHRLWIDDVLYTEEIRQGRHYLRRKSESKFQVFPPPPGPPDVLQATVVSADAALKPFGDTIRYLEGAASDGITEYTISMAPLEVPEGVTPEDFERAHHTQGRAAIPLTLEGTVRVDELGNRLEFVAEGTYRARGRDAYDDVATRITVREERHVPEGGVTLQPPPDMAVYLADQESRENPDEPAAD